MSNIYVIKDKKTLLNAIKNSYSCVKIFSETLPEAEINVFYISNKKINIQKEKSYNYHIIDESFVEKFYKIVNELNAKGQKRKIKATLKSLSIVGSIAKCVSDNSGSNKKYFVHEKPYRNTTQYIITAPNGKRLIIKPKIKDATEDILKIVETFVVHTELRGNISYIIT